MSSCSCPHHDPRDDPKYRKSDVPLRAPYSLDMARPAYSRMSSAESEQSRGSIINPHPQCLSPSASRSQSHSSRRVDPSPLDQYRAQRPLPQIREPSDVWSRGQCLPHRSGVLERGPSSTSTDCAAGASWETRDKSGSRGPGEDGGAKGDGGMEGLYESLRLAIASPVRLPLDACDAFSIQWDDYEDAAC
jgi:hypothetical protein